MRVKICRIYGRNEKYFRKRDQLGTSAKDYDDKSPGAVKCSISKSNYQKNILTIQHYGGQFIKDGVSLDAKMTSIISYNSSSVQHGAVISIMWSGKVSA